MNRPRPAFASWVVVARRDLQSIRASPSGVPFPWCSAARGGRALLPWSRCVPRRPTGLGSSPAHPSPTRRAYRPQRLPGLRSSTPPQNSSGAVRPARRPTPAPDARRLPSAGCARGRHPRRRSPRQRGAPVVRATGSGWKRPEGAHPVSHSFEQACPGDAPENSAEPVGCLRRIRADGASPPTRRRSPSGRRGVRADRGLNPRRHRAQ